MKKPPERILKSRNIGIAGLGLIGASIAKRLIAVDKTVNIIGVDKDEETLKYAFSNMIIHLGHTDLRILRGCEIIFVATPMDTAGDVIREIYNITGKESIITDTASIKREITRKLPEGIRFVGGHPMAGGEKGGIKESKEHLFENAYYIITKNNSSDKDIAAVTDIVAKLGAIPLAATPEEHDSAVARVSHLPHYISYSLINYAVNGGIENKIGATSFRDMTRVADSDPAFWAAAARLNRAEILKAIDGFSSELAGIRECIDAEDYNGLYKLLDSGRAKRKDIEILKYDNYAFTVDVPDKPGIIGKITSLLGRRGVNIANIAIRNSREGASGALRLHFKDEVSFELAKVILAKKYTIKDS